MEIVIVLNDVKDSILKAYPDLLHKYSIYTNDVLQYELDRNNDSTPQPFLFKGDEQLLHIIGIKKKMFVRINEKVGCSK